VQVLSFGFRLFYLRPTAQKNAIASPADGFLVYQTDSVPGFYYYLSGWQILTPPVVNQGLSKLVEPLAINARFLPATAATYDIGATANNWRNLYLSGNVYIGVNRIISDRGNASNFLDTNAGTGLTTGAYNTGTGYQSLYTTNTGAYNTANGAILLPLMLPAIIIQQ
jgi:hypothetical protein